jgi:transcription-repair coupling factor (superfamily II helicase)
MTLFFVNNPDSPFYQSEMFGRVISYMMENTRRCDLREQKNRRSMVVNSVPDMETAVDVLMGILASTPSV